MSQRRTAILGVVLAIAAAVALIVSLPAPDPLRNARTVYLDTGATAGDRGTDELEDGLRFVLNDRNLLLVSNRADADAELRIEDLSVNLGDVTLSLGQGGFTGQVKAVCGVTDLRSGRTYTMDLTVTVQSHVVTAKLVARKFWEFWK